MVTFQRYALCKILWSWEGEDMAAEEKIKIQGEKGEGKKNGVKCFKLKKKIFSVFTLFKQLRLTSCFKLLSYLRYTFFKMYNIINC